MGLIGRALDSMTPAQQERILTREMLPCAWSAGMVHGHKVGPCLVGLAHFQPTFSNQKRLLHSRYTQHSPVREVVAAKLENLGVKQRGSLSISDTLHDHYDALCGRYGYQRVNGWIRDRILRTMHVTEPAQELAHA